MQSMNDSELAERRAKARRNAIILGLVALSFFFAYIIMAVSRASS